MNPMLQHVSLDGQDLQTFIFTKLAPACYGEPLPYQVLGMLAYAIRLMKPDIGVEELQEMVMETSSHIVMQLMPAAACAEGTAN